MKLTIKQCGLADGSRSDDWYIIERAEHDGREWIEKTGYGQALRLSSRFSDADVEGSAEEMLAIAEAIEARGSARFKRCEVKVIDEDHVIFRSPRNSQTDGVCTLAEADELAKLIHVTLVMLT